MNNAGWSAVVDSLRAFLKRSSDLLRKPGGDGVLRAALLSEEPMTPLLILLSRDPQFKARFLDEILEAMARGPQRTVLLARDALRCLPRAVLEDGVPPVLRTLLSTADDYEYSRLAEIIVELRLETSLAELRSAAATHQNEEIRELARDLEDVEHDDRRWGRLVSEWPIAAAAGNTGSSE